MTSAQQVQRLLALVPYLLAHDGASLTETAATFGVTPRQLRADLSVLYMCGLPGLMPGDLIEIDMDAVEGEGTIHLSNADYLSRPLRFTPDEALGLVLGLRSLREVAGEDVLAVVDSALAKLERAAGSVHELAGRVSVSVQSGDDRIRDTVAAAVTAGQRLHLVYDAPTRTTRRQVDPGRVSIRDGVAYLEAWDLERRDWRTFRLDRIASVEPTGEPAEDHGELPASPEGWLEALVPVGEVTLELAPGAAWVAEYHPVLSVEQLDEEGAVRATLPLSDPGWLRALLLQLSDGVRAVVPPEAAEDAARAAAQTLALYRRLDLDGLGSAS
ncbi:WYL domain-containing protein [Auraticoccus sp. F435]|uniref:WYL domain-containing protein n=1 Tax=Auraticoccus cholistanensis TaxID=2656650 RepID=A0A6A9V0L6_9ACTN|nr:WYL domain-containing protein [Auraticoccus cholistanensis]MVA75610.1 WYL domain-containing protein [Auraticoccus cholistanensis]